RITALARLPSQPTSTVPALRYLLAVVAAAAVGRLWPALLASAVSFVCLDYYFTPPTHTFTVAKAEDLFALAVFLVVAALVSTALAAALEQRAMAEFREHQVRALYYVTSRLLSGQPLDDILRDLAASLRTLYGLAGCRVLVTDDRGVNRERASAGAVDGLEVTAIPLTADGRPVGVIEMAGARGLGPAEMEILKTFAGQLALAIERARLRAGALRPTVELVPLEDLVSAVTSRLAPVLSGRPVRVRSREDIPPVPADVVQMDQVLTNLLENAARYSPPGTEISVNASRWQD